jgi:hypothetical protein
MYLIFRDYSKAVDIGILQPRCRKQENNRFSKSIYDQVLKLHKEKYSDFGTTFFSEKMGIKHDIIVSPQNLTRRFSKNNIFGGSPNGMSTQEETLGKQTKSCT